MTGEPRPRRPRGPWSVRVVPAGDGAVRIVARDWPWAPWFAAALALPSVPLLVWSLAEGHAIEGGGAAVLAGVAGFAAWLAMTRRRDLVVSAGPGGLVLRGTEGCPPLARAVDRKLRVPGARLVLEELSTPAGAPALPDRGGELVLVSDEGPCVLARAAGPLWRERLADAQAAVAALLGRS